MNLFGTEPAAFSAIRATSPKRSSGLKRSDRHPANAVFSKSLMLGRLRPPSSPSSSDALTSNPAPFKHCASGTASAGTISPVGSVKFVGLLNV